MTFNNASFAQHSIASLNPELARLLHPGRFYDRPKDVLDDPDLSVSERRAILSSWASDACAVESVPALRHAPFARRPVPFDEIMDALAQLDRQAASRRQRCRRSPGKERIYPAEISA